MKCTCLTYFGIKLHIHVVPESARLTHWYLITYTSRPGKYGMPLCFLKQSNYSALP